MGPFVEMVEVICFTTMRERCKSNDTRDIKAYTGTEHVYKF